MPQFFTWLYLCNASDQLHSRFPVCAAWRGLHGGLGSTWHGSVGHLALFGWLGLAPTCLNRFIYVYINKNCVSAAKPISSRRECVREFSLATLFSSEFALAATILPFSIKKRLLPRRFYGCCGFFRSASMCTLWCYNCCYFSLECGKWSRQCDKYRC